ncbi:lantibiotic dehydratase [Nocardiopsis sp. EMB25]|uniref:lantibiotic dehydratase n=1 Tax=Nocardiopsis sp. EMB25 TaxID=2835867 RepID=UPI0022849AB7|nr:lantibiotic dehydratase [Nocardiopsis sp. EMB25]
MRLASPALAQMADRVCDDSGEELSLRRLRRCAAALMRYRLRARHRPTPFGLFAGVAPVRVGAATAVRWGNDHQAVARPDTHWLATCAARFDEQADRELAVASTSTAQVSGNRLVKRHPVAATPNDVAPVSVRRTLAVERALTLARSPRLLGEVEDALCEEFAPAPRAVVRAMLTRLLRHGFLISAAHAPMTAPDPLRYLLDRTPRSQGLPEPDMSAVDTRLDADITLAPAVVDAATHTADVLQSWAPDRTGSPAWVDYHHRCLERYGPGAVVDLLDLVGPTGVGWPHGYRGSVLPPPEPRAEGERETALTRAAHTAALDGEAEIDLAELPPPHQNEDVPVPPHVELRAHLHASSPEAVDTGDLTLWVTGVSRAVGVLTGRFLHLEGLDQGGYENLPTLTEGAVRVQVTGPPVVESAHNIARTPPVLDHLLVIDEHPLPDQDDRVVFGPDDVQVRIDPDHLLLQRRSTGQIIEPQFLSALEPRWHTHPLVRLCHELPRARVPPHLSFIWPEATDTWTHLPRVRAGKAVVAPALWRLRATDIATPEADTDVWEQGLVHLRSRRRIPQRVRVVEGDSYLPLDLAQPAHRRLLRDHLEHHAPAAVTVTEAPPPNAFAWCQGRAHEIVLPLASTHRPVPPPPIPGVRTTASAHVPGAIGWTSAHLYADTDRHTRILTDHMANLWDRIGGEPAWWVVRYRDHHGPHLRLRLPAAVPSHLAALADWTRALQQAGLVRSLTLETYQPETGRYGHGPAMEAAHAVFAADTTAALAELRHAGDDVARVHAVAAASLLRLAIDAFPEHGLAWAVDHLPRSRKPIDRTAHTIGHQLLRTVDDTADNDLLQAWENRAAALTTYRQTLPQPDHIQYVLGSLLHMHHNRVVGPDRADETRLLELTRALALTLAHTRKAVR